MFEKPSLVRRAFIGEAIGFAIGLAEFATAPLFDPEVGWLLRWGLLLWYTTLGGIIGLLGVFTFHPVLRLPMPWWFRDPVMAAWMNFVLTFFVYDEWQRFMTATFGPDGLLQSPFWFVAEGAVIGLVIGFFATRYGGEGPEIAGR